MVAHYKTIDLNLTTGVSQIGRGEIQLPDFQRQFNWKVSQQAGLLDSIQKLYPTGTLLLLELDNNADSPFGARKFTRAPEPVMDAKFLVLDGQQRLTSCYQAFSGRGKSWFVIDVLSMFQEFQVHGKLDRLELEPFLHRRAVKAQPEAYLFDKHLLPLMLVSDDEDFKSTLSKYRKNLEQNPSTEAFADFVDTKLEIFLKPFFTYHFPAVILPKTLDLEAVANIFTKINTTGLRLSAFDLCVASLFPKKINLRHLWNEAKKKPGVASFDSDGTNLLQTVALLSRKPPKKAALVKNIQPVDISGQWDRAVQGLESASDYLAKAGVTGSKTLPYDALIPSLAAALADAGEVPAAKPQLVQQRREMVHRWVLQTAWLQRYNEGTDVKQAEDTPLVLAWFKGGDVPPFLTEEVYWQESTTTMGRSGARGSAFLAILNRSKPHDFIKTADSLAIETAEQHHIFPKAFLKASGHPDKDAERALNMTLLARESNNFIDDRAPSEYVHDLIATEAAKGVGEDIATKAVRDLLKGHLIDDDAFEALLSDDYASFLAARAASVRTYLSGVGIPVVTGEEPSVPDPDAEVVEEDEDDLAEFDAEGMPTT